MIRQTALTILITIPLLGGCLEDKGRGGDLDGRGGEGGVGGQVGEGGGEAGEAGEGEGEGIDVGETGGQGGDAGGEAGGDPPPPRRTPCDDDEGCDGDRICEGGFCGEPLCAADGDCGSPMLQGCADGRCRDRCGQGVPCFRGGVCDDGLCMPPECEAKEDCGDPLKACEEGVCVDIDACRDDDDCDVNSRCVDGACEPLDLCGGDRNCGDEEICEGGRCHPRSGCGAEDDCEGDEDCIGGRCVPFACRGHADCDPELECRGGDCVEWAAPPITEIVILTRGRTLFPEQQLQFQAIALDAAHDIVATRGFTWETSNGDVVSIDEAGGLATAEALAGTSEIRAGMTDDDDLVIRSSPVLVTVVAPAAPVGLRVRVTDSVTGAPVGGAIVVADAEEARTDDAGVANLAEGAAQVTVFSAAYDTVTVVGSALAGLHIPLDPRRDARSVAGFTGEISFDDVTSEGPLDLGLAGASLAGGFTHFDLDAFVGEVFNTTVSALGQSIDLPLPGGLTLSGELPIVGYTEVKTDYKALADPGFRIAWSFGGRFELSQQVIGQMMGGFDVGSALTMLLPYFEGFEHGVRSAPDVVALPRIVDEDDVDGDGDTEEEVPDYDRFPVRNQEPDHAQRLRLAVTVPAPPAGRGEGTDVTLVFAGADVEGIGFVPLGLSSSVEAETIPMKMAAPHSGLEGGTYAVTALSARVDQALPRELSALISRHDRLPGEVSLGDRFLPYPAGGEWDEDERVMAAVGVDGASVHRAVLESEQGRWTVWYVGDGRTAALPESPEGVADQASGATPRLEAILLPDGMTAEDLLAEGGAGELGDIDAFATAFSRILP